MDIGRYNGNIPYGAVKDVVPSDVAKKLPENIQNIDTDDLARQNSGINAIRGAKGNTALLTLPIYLSFVGLRSINDKVGSPFSFAGEYEKTFLGKLAKAGDTISNTAGKIIPKPVQTGVPKAAKGIKNWILNHSAIARSLTTPIKYENSTAIRQANGFLGRVLGEDGDALFNYGFKGTKDDLIQIFKGEGNGLFWKRLSKAGIETASDKEATAIVRKAMQQVVDTSSKGDKTKAVAKELVEAFSRPEVKDKFFEIKTWHIPTFIGDMELKIPAGKIPGVGKFFTLKVPYSEVANKIRVAAGLSGNELKTAAGVAAVGTTALGRALPSSFGKIYEGFTSDFVGGKLAPVLQAFFLAQAGVKAQEAPKGKKLATFADEAVGTASWMVTMPLATKLMARVAGLKYIGMGKNAKEQTQNVAKYRDMIKSLNKKVDTLTRAQYLEEVKKIKDVYKGNTKFWQKPLKFLGRLLGANMNGETIKPFIENSVPENAGKLQTFGIQMYNNFKQFGYKLNTGKIMGITPGAVARFGLFLLVFSPIVSKPFKWVTNKIFGKPYDPEAEQKEAAKKAQTEAMNPMPESNAFLEDDKNSMLLNYMNKIESKNTVTTPGETAMPLSDTTPVAPEINKKDNLNFNDGAKMPKPVIENSKTTAQPQNTPPKQRYIPSSEPFKPAIKTGLTPEEAKLLFDMDETILKYTKP